MIELALVASLFFNVVFIISLIIKRDIIRELQDEVIYRFKELDIIWEKLKKITSSNANNARWKAEYKKELDTLKKRVK